jgi:hypothetical protein
MSQDLKPRPALQIDSSARARFFHLYATPDGETHLRVRKVRPGADMAPLVGLNAAAFVQSVAPFHGVGRRQFVLNLTGQLDVEVSDGTKQRIGPGDLVLLEDVGSKGHATTLRGPVTCIFLVVAENFDVERWAEPVA